MEETLPHNSKGRIIRNGIIVVLGSLIAALAGTHLSFVIFGDADYRVAMGIATVIPLIVAPIAYWWVVRLVIKLERQARALDILAATDPLTGLSNRRVFMEQASRLTRSSDNKVSVALLDIDHFKQINDRYGHAGGDVALTEVAEILRGSAPADAIIARLGGEEFGILWSGLEAESDSISGIVETMRAQLEQAAIASPTGTISLTASFGLAHFGPEESVDDFLRRADTALYRAKAAGRNRVEIAA